MSEAVASVRVGRERAELFEDRVKLTRLQAGRRSGVTVPAPAVTGIETEVTRNLQGTAIAAIITAGVVSINVFFAINAGGPPVPVILGAGAFVVLVAMVYYFASKRAWLRITSPSAKLELSSGAGDRENLEAFAMDVERACCAPVASSSSSSSAGRAAVTSAER